VGQGKGNQIVKKKVFSGGRPGRGKRGKCGTSVRWGKPEALDATRRFGGAGIYYLVSGYKREKIRRHGASGTGPERNRGAKSLYTSFSPNEVKKRQHDPQP